MSEVKEWYAAYKKVSMPEAIADWSDEVYKLALESKEEFKELLKLFHNEIDMFFKLDLAHILTKLNYTEIIPFLLKTAKDSKEDIDYRFEALVDLIKFEEPEAYDLMMKLADPSCEIPPGWIMEELRDFDDEGNKMAKKLIKGLITTYKHFARYRKPNEKF